MDIPAVHLLLLEQRDRSLEAHTSLNERSKVRLPVEGPRGSFVKCVERVLVKCDSLFTVCLAYEDNTSPTPDPEPSQFSAMPTMEHKLEPTADLEAEPVTKIEPE
ncbi:hypothetical protein DPX16_9150 [Anabarilius grahami]|uniref:Uncharacterized protein n=1 Tax=Anabarilius grahami TaxID=495550 RepID=A0A3N0YAF4_ANAGA|nr:hypothetical protein DPX16_9150 [Anabarilius grahami]